jgi:hypothetical protein
VGLFDEICEPVFFRQTKMLGISSPAPHLFEPLQGGRDLGAFLVFQPIGDSAAGALSTWRLT